MSLRGCLFSVLCVTLVHLEESGPTWEGRPCARSLLVAHRCAKVRPCVFGGSERVGKRRRRELKAVDFAQREDQSRGEPRGD